MPPVAPAPELAHLPLAALRSYRQDLVDEESRVSYWRRILQARLDLLRATGDRDVLVRLQSVLAHASAVSRRASLLAVLPADDVPPLPDLGPLWEVPAQDGGPGGPAARSAVSYADLLARLTTAEQQLSAYRGALHVRLDRATDELILRYTEDPRRCLHALPDEARDLARDLPRDQAPVS